MCMTTRAAWGLRLGSKFFATSGGACPNTVVFLQAGSQNPHPRERCEDMFLVREEQWKWMPCVSDDQVHYSEMQRAPSPHAGKELLSLKEEAAATCRQKSPNCSRVFALSVGDGQLWVYGIPVLQESNLW